MFRAIFKQNLSRNNEDLVDILFNLSKKNSVLRIDINEGLNVSNVGDKFPTRKKLIPNNATVFNDSRTSEKNSEAKDSTAEDGRLKGF